jgi:hypothetical protein
MHTVTSHVADNDPQLSGGKHEQVIPITADRPFFGGDVTGCEAKSRTTRQLLGQ